MRQAAHSRLNGKADGDKRADAREMQQLADHAGIKLMVNYWNAWVPSSHALFHRVKAGDIGPVQKIVVQYGHEGPKEIGVSQQFADWLYDPAKNGGGALMDFGCYGAEWALWLKGRPTRVYATARTLKTDQHNRVEDDATIVLDYPDATVDRRAFVGLAVRNGSGICVWRKGSLLATRDDFFSRPQSVEKPATLDGDRVALDPAPRETSNPVAYFLGRIRNNQPIEDPLTAQAKCAGDGDSGCGDGNQYEPAELSTCTEFLLVPSQSL